MKGHGDEYRFYYCSNKSGFGGAGVLLAETWADEVIEVQRISDRVSILKFMIGSRVLTFVSVYAPQASLIAAINELIFDQLHFVFCQDSRF